MELYKKIKKQEIERLDRTKEDPHIRSRCLCLDKNERSYSFNDIILEKIRKNISSNVISKYPDLISLYEKLSFFASVNKNQLLLTDGADGAIRLVYESCVKKGDTIVVPSLSYAMYKVYAAMFGINLKTVGIDENWEFNIDKILSYVDEKTKLVVMETPSGSLGNIYQKEEIEKCAKFLLERNVVLLIDEVYWGISEKYNSVSDVINKYPNVVVVRSFSKMPGIAGIRVGYLMGDYRLVEYISKARSSYEISGFSAMICETFLNSYQIFVDYRKKIELSKTYLKEELSKLAIKYKDTYANFIMVYFPIQEGMIDINKGIKDHSILLKPPSKEKFLEGWVRITVGTMDDSIKLILSLKQIIKGE